jgi:predicted glycoside hydrolase/deacetylase ChbG (UPF0249 family)
LAVISHADDFGESAEITAGIAAAIEAGVVTSSSIMANMPGTLDALQRAPHLSDRASFGVHLNLCEGRPLSAGKTLVDEGGHLYGKRALFVRAVTGRLSLTELEEELTEQIARVHDSGIRVSHVDGHKHLHQLPVVSTAVANVLPRFRLERVRITRTGRLTSAAGAAGLVREILARRAAGRFGRARLRSPVRTLDLAALMTCTADAYPRLVDPSGAVELCCHPGTAIADTEKPGSHVRSAELGFLLSPRFQELLSAARARLVTYWDV